MRAKKIIAAIITVALVGAVSVTTVFAATSSSTHSIANGQSSERHTARSFRPQNGERFNRAELTEQQKADLQAKRQSGEWFSRMELTEQQKTDMQAKMNERLEQALADGTITQEQYDAMIDALQNGEWPNRAELTEQQKADMQAKMNERLAQALEDGTITQEQYDEILTAFENGERPTHKGGFGRGFNRS